MKRRFQLAKALVHDPDIIILDEPTAGVDVELRRDLWQYLRDLHNAGKTILLTTHYIEEAELLCDRVAIIDEGKILKEGNPKILTQELGSAGITINIAENKSELKSLFQDFKFTYEDKRIHFSVKNPDKALPKIIDILSNANIHIKSIKSNKSSLEDVFLDLTGKNILMNWVGFSTLIKREVGRFFSVYRQTVLPGLITSSLYIAIFGFTLEQRIAEIQGVPYTLFILPGLISDEHINKCYCKHIIIHAANETITATSRFTNSTIIWIGNSIGLHHRWYSTGNGILVLILEWC